MTNTQTTKSNHHFRLLMALAVLTSLLIMASAAGPTHAETTFLVNSLADQPDADTTDGKCFALNASCTLRAAIQRANATSGADVIDFAIGGSGVQTITPSTALPPITEQVTLDGYSQTGASPNTKTVGDDASLKIELDGARVPDANGLEILGSSRSVIRGLVINRFGVGVAVHGASAVGNHIEGNFIGTDPTGTIDRGNKFDGVEIFDGSSRTVVGGSTPEKRNVLSGNGDDGVFLVGSNANRIQGNYVGTDKSGTRDLGNRIRGVSIIFASDAVASRNVISGNGDQGLIINGSQGTRVLGNRIGTTASGTAALGNSLKGVLIKGSSDSLIGDGTSFGSNTIAFNGLGGVEVDGASTGNKVSQNSAFSNAGLGIDLLGPGEDFGTNASTANDPGDGDKGSNNLQNKPVLSSARNASGKTTIKGKLNSIPSTPTTTQTFTIEFYSNPSDNEGKKFIGEKRVKTDGSGNASFTFSPTRKVAVGQNITATATKNSSGDTSELSAPRKVVAS